MEFKWHLIRCKTEDHAYLPRMVKDIKDQLKILKEQVLLAEKNNSKGFGK